MNKRLAFVALVLVLTALLLPPARTSAASSCGPNFCTTAERTACNQTCFAHHHFPFVGLECCTATCQSFCNCGSVPTGC
jgi:hypothetical protein